MNISQGSVITIGNFDGVHLGHRKLLSTVTWLANRNDLKSVVLSYTDHPAFILKAHARSQVLTPAIAKKDELLACGIDQVELLNFTPELAQTTALKFLTDYLLPVWNPQIIVMGHDSHFGHHRQGNYEFLKSHSSRFGYRVEYVEPLLWNNAPLSSSVIRNLLLEGHLETANELLGRPYRISGKVSHGISKGRSFGFPTANLTPESPHQLIPKNGIYLCQVILGDRSLFGLTNIGSSPTVKHTGITEIETHILDFNEEIYGMDISLELLKYLREEVKFRSEEELVRAIGSDVDAVKAMLQAGIHA